MLLRRIEKRLRRYREMAQDELKAEKQKLQKRDERINRRDLEKNGEVE